MFQPDLLRGKRFLVTGGGTGLGLAMGRHFLELGAELVICGRREAVLAEAAEKLGERLTDPAPDTAEAQSSQLEPSPS
jgi:short-subunit dehydrogenase involved in D-alanine esterification of teichoic acids